MNFRFPFVDRFPQLYCRENIVTQPLHRGYQPKVPLKTETIRSPKPQFELVLHGTNSQKASLIDIIMKAPQKTVFFDH
jgi:hypothetical protein